MLGVVAAPVNPWIGVVTALLLAVAVAVWPRNQGQTLRTKWGVVASLLAMAALFFAATRV